MPDFKYMCRFYHKAVFTIHHNKNINNCNDNYIQYQLIKYKYFVQLLLVSEFTLRFIAIWNNAFIKTDQTIKSDKVVLDFIGCIFLQLRICSIKFETSIAHVQVVILNITYHNRVITCKSSYATSSNKIVYISHTSFVPRMMTFWMKIEWQDRCLPTGVKSSC